MPDCHLWNIFGLLRISIRWYGGWLAVLDNEVVCVDECCCCPCCRLLVIPLLFLSNLYFILVFSLLGLDPSLRLHLTTVIPLLPCPRPPNAAPILSPPPSPAHGPPRFAVNTMSSRCIFPRRSFQPTRMPARCTFAPRVDCDWESCTVAG